MFTHTSFEFIFNTCFLISTCSLENTFSVSSNNLIINYLKRKQEAIFSHLLPSLLGKSNRQAEFVLWWFSVHYHWWWSSIVRINRVKMFSVTQCIVLRKLIPSDTMAALDGKGTFCIGWAPLGMACLQRDGIVWGDSFSTQVFTASFFSDC